MSARTVYIGIFMLSALSLGCACSRRAPRPSGGGGDTYTLGAIEPWAVGRTVSAGERLRFAASGTWCWGRGGDCSDADGTPGRPGEDELPSAQAPPRPAALRSGPGAPSAAPSAPIQRARPFGLGRSAARLRRPSGWAGAREAIDEDGLRKAALGPASPVRSLQRRPRDAPRPWLHPAVKASRTQMGHSVGFRGGHRNLNGPFGRLQRRASELEWAIRKASEVGIGT
jgi:hypothetical protein